MIKKIKCYSYIRFSSEAQQEGDSLRRQFEMAVRYAKENDLDLQEVSYRDLGMSAYRGANSETGALAQFVEACRSGAVEPGSYLLVESLDRISRASPLKAVNALQSIVLEGITVVTLTDRQKYTEDSLNNDPGSLLLAIITAVRANQESALKSSRGKAAWVGKRIKAAEDGLKLTARTPAWLKLDPDRKSFTLVPTKVAAVRRVFDLADEGMSLHGIVKQMTAEKVPSLTGTLWTRVPLKRLLTSPSVIGIFSPSTLDYDAKTKKKVRTPAAQIEGYFPPIIHKDQFDRIQRLFTAPVTGKAARGISNIFSGVLRCGHCGGNMHMVARGKDANGNARPSYVACENRDRGRTAQLKRQALKIRRCPTGMVQYRHLEAAFLAMDPVAEIDNLTTDGAAADHLTNLQSARDALQSNLEDLLSVKSSKMVKAKLDDLAEELATIEDQIDEAEKVVADSTPSVQAYRMVALREAMVATPLDKGVLNGLLRQSADEVKVVQDKGQLQINWRGSEVATEVAYRWVIED